MALSNPCGAGPLRLDPDQAAKVLPSTLALYKKAGKRFAAWLDREGFSPSSAEAFDDLLVEWKNSETVGKSELEQTVACVEFFFPRWRGSLRWARDVQRGWDIVHVARHTVPLD